MIEQKMNTRIKSGICQKCRGKGKVSQVQFLQGGREFGKYATCEACEGSGLVELKNDSKQQIKVSDMTLERLGVIIRVYEYQNYTPYIKKIDKEFYLIIE